MSASARKILRLVELLFTLVSMSLVYSLSNPGLVVQVKNLGLISASCFAYLGAGLIARLAGLPPRIIDACLPAEFALDFLFCIAAFGGGVVTVAKCNSELDGHRFCAGDSAFILDRGRPITAAAFSITTGILLSSSLSYDYFAWLQSHVKYDEYEGPQGRSRYA